MGIDCASTRGIFRKHSDGMNLICSIFIHVCRCCRSNPFDITQSVHRRNLHNSQVMVRSKARNGLRMMPQQHGARKTQHRFLRDFCQFFESNHSDQFKFRNCSECMYVCMYVYIYVYVLSVNCKCSFLFIYVQKHTNPVDIKRKSQVISFQRSLVPGNGSHADRNYHERAQQGVISFSDFGKGLPSTIWSERKIYST